MVLFSSCRHLYSREQYWNPLTKLSEKGKCLDSCYSMKSNLKLLIIQCDIKFDGLKTSLFCLVSNYSRDFSLMFSLLIRKQDPRKAKELCPAASKEIYKIIQKAILLKKISKFRKSVI